MTNKYAKDDLGTRMKRYEKATGQILTPRMPTIIRIDGKAFHSFTKKAGFSFPFSENFHSLMLKTAQDLVSEIQCAQVAYFQSDEISILLNDWRRFNSEQWFNGNVQKMTSVSASIATASFNLNYIVDMVSDYGNCPPNFRDVAMFDSRVFQLPINEVNNYFLWRQQDATRNSVQMLGRSHFSHKEMHGKNVLNIKKSLEQEYAVSWDDLEVWKRLGTCVTAKTTDHKIPSFSGNTRYFEKYLGQHEE